MKRISVHPILSLLIIAVSAWGCHSDQKQATTVAQTFLQAYYIDFDFDKAMALSSEASHAAIAEQAQMASLNLYAEHEKPEIIFKKLEIDPETPMRATCTYTCNQAERTLPLRRFKDRWLIDVPYGTVETGGSNLLNLSTESHGGFAAAASGPVVYKKRKRNN